MYAIKILTNHKLSIIFTSRFSPSSLTGCRYAPIHFPFQSLVPHGMSLRSNSLFRYICMTQIYMKYWKYIVLLLFTLLYINVFGQYKPIILGLKAAPNIAWMKPDSEGYSSESVKPGFGWGLVAEFYFMENYAVLTGFSMNWLNAAMSFPALMETEADTVAGTILREYNFRYIDVPLVIKMQADITGKFRIYGKVGLGVGFRLSAKAKDEFTYDSEMVTSEQDITSETTLARGSLILGGGVAYIIKGSTAVSFDITYNDGFINVLKGYNDVDTSMPNKANLKFVEFNIGIVF